MAGQTSPGVLMGVGAGSIRFALAGEAHDAGIRRLLREVPMHGDMAISLQREPGYFAAARMEGGEHQAIVALDRHDNVVCAGGVSIRERYYNGQRRRVGYLGQLRLAASHAGRFDIVRRGYQFFRELHPAMNLDACFTSIAADNTRAVRLLERDVPGLPRYEPAGQLATLLIPTSTHILHRRRSAAPAEERLRSLGLSIERGAGGGVDRLAALLDRDGSSLQFAPCWDAGELGHLFAGGTLREEGVRVLCDSAGPVACAALWDQRRWKQAVVARYSRRMSLLRPFYNALAAVSGRTPLPPPQCAVQQAFISHVAAPIEQPEWLAGLVEHLIAPAAALGLTMLAIGLDSRDPRLGLLLARFRPRLYHTRIYSVIWPDMPPRAGSPDGRLLYPEVALL